MKFVFVVWGALAWALVPAGAQTPLTPPAPLQQIESFLDRCPAADPALGQIRADFEILRDGRPVSVFPCTEPYTKTPLAQFSAETSLMQILRLTYYLDQGRSGHLPWTNLRLYDWFKSKLGGINIRSDATLNACCESINGKNFMIYAGGTLNETNRAYLLTLTGLLSNVALLAHEARHVDGFPHVSCCGLSFGCDQNYDERNLSPYGIQYFLQRAWLTGSGFQLNLGCLDQSLTPFPQTVTDANIYVSRFCDAKPQALPATTEIGGRCQPGRTPLIALGGIANVANFRTDSIAAGSAVSIFGEGLSGATAATEAASRLPLETSMRNVTVSVGGKAAPLFFVSPGQVNVQVPYDAPQGPTELTLTAGGNVSFRRRITVRPTAPALFVKPDNFVIAQNEDYSLNSLENPARIGSYVTVYFTGQGLSDNPVASGAAAPTSPLSRPLARAQVLIGGRPQSVQFVGLTPGFVGLSQVNIQIVTGTPLGAQSIVLALDNFGSPASSLIAIAR